MGSYDPAYIKVTRPLLPELRRYGVEPDARGFARCPFHAERTASFKVYGDGTYHCFGCGAHGDVITLTMRMLDIPFAEACAQLSGDLRYSEMRSARKAEAQHTAQNRRLQRAKEAYHTAFDRWQAYSTIIDRLRPAGPEEKPQAAWLEALSALSGVEAELDAAETEYYTAMRKEG